MAHRAGNLKKVSCFFSAQNEVVKRHPIHQLPKGGDGTAAYVKYTLDGQNVTEDVIAGVIPKAMMDGYERCV